MHTQPDKNVDRRDEIWMNRTTAAEEAKGYTTGIFSPSFPSQLVRLINNVVCVSFAPAVDATRLPVGALFWGGSLMMRGLQKTAFRRALSCGGVRTDTYGRYILEK